MLQKMFKSCSTLEGIVITVYFILILSLAMAAFTAGTALMVNGVSVHFR